MPTGTERFVDFLAKGRGGGTMAEERRRRRRRRSSPKGIVPKGNAPYILKSESIPKGTPKGIHPKGQSCTLEKLE